MNQAAAPLVRFALLAALGLTGVLVIAIHGVRGLVVVGALALIVMLLRSTAWRTVENVLARVTGSRARAYGLVLGTIIVVVTTVNILELVR